MSIRLCAMVPSKDSSPAKNLQVIRVIIVHYDVEHHSYLIVGE